MKFYFIEGDDIGYQDMGLFQSKYTALIFAKRIAAKAANGKRYRLRNADDVVLAEILSLRKGAAFAKWTENIDN